ncbi:MAG: HAMP domain-containing sensor histidine kinase [Planctomycetota bacterium]
MSPPRHDPSLDPAGLPTVTPAQLAHELNNLLDGSLRNVGMAARGLSGGLLDEPTRDELTERLRAAGRSMRQMAEVIERYAQTPDGQSPGEPTSALMGASGTIADAVRHAIEVYRPTLGQQGIELLATLDSEAADLPAGAVYTLLANGINNARQAIEQSDGRRSHTVSIEVLREADELVVRICDTGAGIDPQLLDEAGDFRYGVTTRPTGHGIGLGVCRQIAEDLGGALTLVDAPTGRGAWLTLRYPAAPGASRLHAETIGEAGGRRAG